MTTKIDYDIMKHPADFAKDTAARDISLDSALEQLEGKSGARGEWLKEMIYYYEALTRAGEPEVDFSLLAGELVAQYSVVDDRQTIIADGVFRFKIDYHHVGSARPDVWVSDVIVDPTHGDALNAVQQYLLDTGDGHCFYEGVDEVERVSLEPWPSSSIGAIILAVGS